MVDSVVYWCKKIQLGYFFGSPQNHRSCLKSTLAFIIRCFEGYLSPVVLIIQRRRVCRQIHGVECKNLSIQG